MGRAGVIARTTPGKFDLFPDQLSHCPDSKFAWVHSIDEQLLLRILNAARQHQMDLVESRLGMWMEQVSVQATAQATMLLAQAAFSSPAAARVDA